MRFFEMHILAKASATAALVVSLTGCIVVGGVSTDSNNWREQQRENALYISSLELGTAPERVIEELGTPSSSEAFMQKSAEVRVLYYRTQHKKSDGETTKDETTPLVFVNDKLVGWGESALVRTRLN